MDFSFRRTIALTYRQVERMAVITREQDGSTLTKKQVAQAKADRLPESIISYGRDINGFVLEWQVPGTPPLYGYIRLLPVHNIYHNVTKGAIYVDLSGEDAADELPPPDPRLLVYRPIDEFHNSTVGLLHDEHRSPELHYYSVKDEAPCPLGIDLVGYVQLLQLSCGFVNWTSLLVQLASPEGQSRPFRLLPGLHGNSIREEVAQLAQLLPDFSLDAFAALYDRVKLPVEHTWAAAARKALTD